MFLKEFKPTTLALSLSLLFSAPTFAQQQPSGAGAAKGAAVGGVTAGTIAAAVAVVAIAAALSGGSSGAAPTSGNQDGDTVALQALEAAKSAALANGETASALAALDLLVPAGASAAVLGAQINARSAQENAVTAAAVALAFAQDLKLAQENILVSALKSSDGNRVLCALSKCSEAERVGLAFKSATAAKTAAEASLFAISQMQAFLDTLAAAGVPTASLAPARTFLGLALAKATTAQTQANASIAAYTSMASKFNIVGTTIAASTGTSGTLGSVGTTGSQ